ncbi:MAG: DinB family protein [Candidatus Thorarchaeota archaeon]
MKDNTKKAAISLLATSECNLLYSLRGLRSEDIYRQAQPELNSIGWIFGHCAVHMDWVLSLITEGTRAFSEEVCYYYRYGTTKSEILDGGTPISFSDLLDSYLKVSESFLTFLTEIEEDTLYKAFPGEPSEDLMQTILRVSLHFMGHAGQIVLIRRALGNPGPSFVSGVKKDSREQIMADWHDWWRSNRESFQD